MTRPVPLSPTQARRGVLAAQGFAGSAARGQTPDRRAVMRVVRRLGLVQIDSVNVLSRAHYLPAFSRLGPYERALLDDAGARAPRAVFEYWGHEASLLPVTSQPLLRWRMAQQHPWASVARTADEHPDLAREVHDCVAAIGPATGTEIERVLAADAPRRTGGWGWNWSLVKTLLEHLFWAGTITSAGRDRQFRRRYAVTDAVLPRSVRDAATPPRAAAIRDLVAIAAGALGVATMSDLRDYFRLSAPDTADAVAALTAAGVLQPVAVAGWPPAWRHRQLRIPRFVAADALLVPFDPLIWQRDRVQRLFDLHYRIEIYVPAGRRRYGYYVLPFLQDDRITALVDLKADRAAGVLRVRAAHGHAPDAATPQRLRTQLIAMAQWLDLASVAVDDHAPGDLAGSLGGVSVG